MFKLSASSSSSSPSSFSFLLLLLRSSFLLSFIFHTHTHTHTQIPSDLVPSYASFCSFIEESGYKECKIPQSNCYSSAASGGRCALLVSSRSVAMFFCLFVFFFGVLFLIFFICFLFSFLNRWTRRIKSNEKKTKVKGYEWKKKKQTLNNTQT